MMAGPPPLLRDDRLTLDQLGAMAREFDQISAEDGWSSIVDWGWGAAAKRRNRRGRRRHGDID
jgi:hypothetical protein